VRDRRNPKVPAVSRAEPYGGPNFVGQSNVIAGVTSYGLNWTCGGTGGVYRVDRADDLA